MISFSFDKQRGQVNVEWMSRPVDSYKNSKNNQPLALVLTSMEQSPTFASRLKRKLLSGPILGGAYIPADKYQSRTFKMKSIALPSSQSLFDNNLFIDYDLKITTKDGNELYQKIPLMGELGTLITKSQSVSKDKRYRDSLDIYLTLKQSGNLTALINSVTKLKGTHIDTYNNLYGIRQAYEDKTLLANTMRFLDNLNKDEFIHTFEIFFDKTGLNNEATN